MSLSSNVLEQREKEAKALKSFLIYSLICSFVIHIGVIALSLSNFLMKFPKVKDELMEMTLVEVPNQEITELTEIQKWPSKVNASGGSVDGGGGKPNQQQTAIDADNSSISVVKQPTVQSSEPLLPKKTQSITSPIQKLVERLNTSPQQPTTPNEISKQVLEPSLLSNNSIKKLVERLNTPPKQPTTPTEPSKPLTNTIQTVPNSSTSPTSIDTQTNGMERSLTSGQSTGSHNTNGSGNGVGNGSGNGIGNGSGNGVGNGSGNGVGNGSGNGVGNQPKQENTTVATDPKLPTHNNSRLDRADCLKCDIKYPDRARRRGREGNPEIAVDTDDNGNVTRVRLIRSSGDRELDEAVQISAQEWKLKPTSGGRQGVRASVNFAIKGSPRHRELQERQRRRQTEAVQKKPETTSAVPTPTETPKTRQRSTRGVVMDVPLENSTRRTQESAPSPQVTPRKPIESDTTNPSQQTIPRRPQRTESHTPTQSQESKSEGVQRRRRKLADILRRSQTSESTTTDAPVPPSTPPADSTNNN